MLRHVIRLRFDEDSRHGEELLGGGEAAPAATGGDRLVLSHEDMLGELPLEPARRIRRGAAAVGDLKQVVAQSACQALRDAQADS